MTKIQHVVAALETMARREQTMEPAVQKSKVLPGARFLITAPTYLHQQPQMEGSGFKVKAPAGYEVEATGKTHQNMVEVMLAITSVKVPSQIRNKPWWVDADSLGRPRQSSALTTGKVRVRAGTDVHATFSKLSEMVEQLDHEVNGSGNLEDAVPLIKWIADNKDAITMALKEVQKERDYQD